MVSMLRRFISIKGAVNHALIEMNEKIVDQSTIDAIEQLLVCLEPLEVAILELGKEDTNLLSADIIISEAIEKIKMASNSELAKSIIQAIQSRIVARRTVFSDCLQLFYEKHFDLSKNAFYRRPTIAEVVECYHGFYGKIPEEPYNVVIYLIFLYHICT